MDVLWKQMPVRLGMRRDLAAAIRPELGRRTGVYVQLLPLCWKAGKYMRLEGVCRRWEDLAGFWLSRFELQQ